ncbi:hypothetical protein [Kitasatospora sp. NPDC059327]|uniref:hypothetical protein n=1 Tax=Kitasatospora sp. NPDC059327 TaxID=3346803 RepID=UPI0036AF73A0
MRRRPRTPSTSPAAPALLVPPPGDQAVAARVTGGQLTAVEPITCGLSAAEAARALGIGRQTVTGHLRLLYARVGARTAAHATYLLHGLRRLPPGHPCPCRGRGGASAKAPVHVAYRHPVG